MYFFLLFLIYVLLNILIIIIFKIKNSKKNLTNLLKFLLLLILRFYYLLENKTNDKEAFNEYNKIVLQIPTQISFNKLLQRSDIMRGIFLGLIVSVAQVFSGSMATVVYSTSYV